jgi:hypothetical protein
VASDKVIVEATTLWLGAITKQLSNKKIFRNNKKAWAIYKCSIQGMHVMTARNISKHSIYPTSKYCRASICEH